MAAWLSALRAGRTLPPGFFIFKDSWYLFLLEAESTPGPVRVNLKKSTSSGLPICVFYKYIKHIEMYILHTYIHTYIQGPTGSANFTAIWAQILLTRNFSPKRTAPTCANAIGMHQSAGRHKT
jgi:hypothetical protein